MSGSQSYDPFAYGSVKIGQDGAPRGAAAGSPDDILFSEAALPGAGGCVETTRRSMAGAADTSWDPMDPNTGTAGLGARLDATDFGADILGETGTLPPRPTPQPRAAAPAPRAVPATPPVSGPGARHAAAGTNWAEAVAGSSPRPAAGAVVTPAQGLRGQAGKRRASTMSVVLPTIILSAALAGSAWLFLVGKNPVMAALAAAVGLVGAAIAWISTRP